MDESPEQSTAEKKRRMDTDFSLCVICQKRDGSMIQTPKHESLSKLLECVNARGQYGDGDYPSISSRLERFTATDLEHLKTTYHRDCYSNTCNTANCDRARKRYENAISRADTNYLQTKVGRPARCRSVTPTSDDGQPEISSPCTRSSMDPFDKTLCFFCQTHNSREALHEMSSESVGIQLRDAVEAGSNAKWKVQLNTAIPKRDARAIDAKYHLPCWVKNVQRQTNTPIAESASETITTESESINLICANIEFITLVKTLLKEGAVLSMSDLHVTYLDVLQTNEVRDFSCNRQYIKHLLKKHIPAIEFARAKRRNEADKVFLKATKENVMDEASENAEDDIMTIFKCAEILRKSVSESESWEFNGTLSSDDADNHIPYNLYTCLRWIIQGPTSSLCTAVRKAQVHKNTLSVAQNLLYAFKSDRQVKYKPKSCNLPFISRREWPQLLAIGIAVHKETRSKKLVNLLHSFGLSVEYNRILRVETQLANAVLDQMLVDGAYIPPMMVKGEFIYFAIDNTDFSEDTPDGKRTLHGTVTAVYQREQDPPNICIPMDLKEHARNRTLKSLPPTELLQCRMIAKDKPKSPVYNDFKSSVDITTSTAFKLKDTAWMVARSVIGIQNYSDSNITDPEDLSVPEPPVPVPEPPVPVPEPPVPVPEPPRPVPLVDQANITDNTATRARRDIPTWSAYNSLTGTRKPRTLVGTPPLLAEPAHEWQTLLTVLKQAQNISAVLVGPERKTVITLDMQLYEKAKQLEMTRQDCKYVWILRIGEMHTVMAALRAAGSAIEDSGIDEAWMAADIYGPLTVKQILEAKHMKRALTAHMITLQAMFELYWEELLKTHPEFQDICSTAACGIAQACSDGSRDDVKDANNLMETILSDNDIVKVMTEFDTEKEQRCPLFKFVMRYMKQIQTIFIFIRAVREGNWELYLSSLDSLCKYFFAHDKQKYARLVPLYLAEMNELEQKDPDIWQEFIAGNFVVNKNVTPFCAIGTDHGVEHVNRWMKVAGGLLGITLNPNARERFFLTAPELARLAEEAHAMAGVNNASERQHHELSSSVQARFDRNIIALKESIRSSTNPMSYDDSDLPSIITNVVMPANVAHDICNRDEIGQRKYTEFVAERITSSDVNIWSRMPKLKLGSWKSARKRVKHKLANKVIELKDDRSLFARLLIIARSRPEVDLKNAIGRYEFTSLPRALFAPDGSVVPSTDKSKLMEVLERLPQQTTAVPTPTSDETIQQEKKKVAVIDAMVLVQALGKPKEVKTCLELANRFVKSVDITLHGCEEGHLIFDRYDIQDSLKSATRRRRTGSTEPIAYHIADTTSITTVTAKQLLASTKTKDELTVYLAKKCMDHFHDKPKTFIVSARQSVFSNARDVGHLTSSQEEADTRIILHGIDATANGATELHIHSVDTDVLVLALRRYPRLCTDTFFHAGTGNKRRVIPLEPIYAALGDDRAAALPGFHAFTGADQTGKFAGKGKLGCWKTFMKSPDDVEAAFNCLGKDEEASPEMISGLEKFVCRLYDPGTKITDIGLLRWHLFSKKQSEGQKLPPTKAALHQSILRAHYQSMIWAQDDIPNPQLPPPTQYGWTKEDDAYIPLPTTLPPAPDDIVELVKCGCKVSRCAARCSCRTHQLACTELCLCEADQEVCTNVTIDRLATFGDDDTSSDDDISI